jgi:hypothetical protein
MKQYLPGLGVRVVRRLPNGDWLWLSSFGWHNCTRNENALLEGSK